MNERILLIDKCEDCKHLYYRFCDEIYGATCLFYIQNMRKLKSIKTIPGFCPLERNIETQDWKNSKGDVCMKPVI